MDMNNSDHSESISIQHFDISYYINKYKEQFNELTSVKSGNNYNINTLFDVIVSLITNTVIYRDLPLPVIEEFENTIDWDKQREENDDFQQPFITHLNPLTKTFITSFVSNDYSRIDDGPYGIQFMNQIASDYNYNYKIVMYKQIKKIMSTCKLNKIKDENVILIDDGIINTLSMFHKTMMDNDTTSNLTNSSNSSSMSQMQSISGSSNVSQPQQKLILRSYQQEILNKMNQNSHSIIKLPCGMGKSIIMIYHMFSHKQNSIILVPNIALVDQFHDNIITLYTILNSNNSGNDNVSNSNNINSNVNSNSNNNSSNVNINVNNNNSNNINMPVIHTISSKSNPDNIKTNDPHNDKQHIIICVYNSFVNQFLRPIYTNTLQTNDDTIFSIIKSFYYIYIDEAHHIILPSNQRVQSNIKTCLEQYTNNETQNEEQDFVQILHSNPSLSKSFASLIYTYSYYETSHSYMFSATINPSNISLFNMFSAIQAGYLCKLNIDILVDDNFSKLEIPFVEKVNNCAAYLSRSPYKHIIIYTSRVSTARDLQKALPFRSEVITATMSSQTRCEAFDKFRNNITRALITVNCISEGVDLPCADAAVFFDDKKSIINIIQCVGRVMRLYDSKLSCSLVLLAYNSDDITSIYQNTLSIINGELGYGSADIRRSVRIIINSNIRHKRSEIKNKVYHQIYEYNENYFATISLNGKIRTCAYFYSVYPYIPTLDLSIYKSKMPNGEYFDLHQFVHDNLYLPNEAGKRLRAIYGLTLKDTVTESIK